MDFELKKLGLFAVITSELVGIMALGVGIGYLGYSRYHWSWWAVLLSSCVGLSLGIYRVYQISQKEL